MKIYISGDTDAEDYGERFMEAEETLTRKGDTVLNMAAMELLYPELGKEECMALNFGIIDVCDAVYMLKGWDESGQSMREFCYAFARDKLMKGDVVGHRRHTAVKKGESQEKRRTGTMGAGKIDVGDAASIFAPCAEYTGREVMELLRCLPVTEQQETASGAHGSFVPCRECMYVQHLFDGGMQCRNLKGLACEVKEDDGCSHGVFTEGSRL